MDGFVIDVENYLAHYGTPRHSGRYPWGSGGIDEARSRDFVGIVAGLRKDGLSETDIAKSFGITTTQLRATTTIAKNRIRAANISQAQRLKDKGYSNGAIADKMGLPGESSVRALLEPGAKYRTDQLTATSEMLRGEVEKRGFIDVGTGVERYTGNTRTQFDTAVAILEREGYVTVNVQIDQVGSGSQKTTIKVLCPPGKTEKEYYKELVTNKDKIQSFTGMSDDGKNYTYLRPPEMLSSSRVKVHYAEEGGSDADGTMYIRPGVKDLNMGASHYAQVRIAVDGSHYLKGMAIYKEGLPDGVDVVFNTNKSNTGNKLDAMKPLNKKADGTVDMENPFSSSIKPGGQRGVLNILNEEGDWNNWSSTLASQVLSKQRPVLAKELLGAKYKKKVEDLAELEALTNPAVKRKLLQSLADDVDASALHLVAAAMPRQRTQVILPVPSLKDTEIFAPNFNDGERVALVRFPHGGVFEIPELTVNNKQAAAVKLIGKSAIDAVGINPRVAERLSGADFDGDTVLVIPNGSGKLKSKPALEGLKGFDPKKSYPYYDGMKVISPRTKQIKMGEVSNLITDMTIKGANDTEIARAVRHSMVVIDAEKHRLNYKQSAEDNGIAALAKKYQGNSTTGKGGSSTLISRSESPTKVLERKSSFTIDRDTGQKVFKETGASYVDKNGKTVFKMSPSVKGAEVKSAHELSSGTAIEKVYADHADRMRALGNEARKAMVSTKSIPYSPSAKKVYAPEVDSLNAKLNVALKNAPLERKAQLLANAIVAQKKADNPNLDPADVKKISGRALTEARIRTGAGKVRVDITDREWAAIQAGAITNNKLTQILNNADLEKVKVLATPRTPTVMTSAKQAQAKMLLASGRTAAEVAQIVGVNVNTLRSSLKED